MGRKYYAYGTYAENGILYSANGKEIKNPESYYEACRKKYKNNNDERERRQKALKKMLDDDLYFQYDENDEFYKDVNILKK